MASRRFHQTYKYCMEVYISIMIYVYSMSQWWFNSWLHKKEKIYRCSNLLTWFWTRVFCNITTRLYCETVPIVLGVHQSEISEMTNKLSKRLIRSTQINQNLIFAICYTRTFTFEKKRNIQFIHNILHRKTLVAIEGTSQQHITNLVSRIDSNTPERKEK